MHNDSSLAREMASGFLDRDTLRVVQVCVCVCVYLYRTRGAVDCAATLRRSCRSRRWALTGQRALTLFPPPSFQTTEEGFGFGCAIDASELSPPVASARGPLPRCFEEAGAHWGVAVAAEPKFLRRGAGLAAASAAARAEEKRASAEVGEGAAAERRLVGLLSGGSELGGHGGGAGRGGASAAASADWLNVTVFPCGCLFEKECVSEGQCPRCLERSFASVIAP